MKKMTVISVVMVALGLLSGCASQSSIENKRFVDEVVRQNILNYNDNIREMEAYNNRQK